MLALKLTNGKRNIIHMIFGPQTQFQFDMIGFIYLELGKMLASFDDRSLPLGIVITRCDDETMTFQAIASSIGQSETNEHGVIYSDNNYMEMIGKIASVSNDAHNTFFGTDGLDEQEEAYADSNDYVPEEEDIDERVEKLKEEAANTPPKNKKPTPNEMFGIKATYTKGDMRGIYIENCICALCGSEGVYARKGIQVMCADCLKIEYGRHKLDSSSLPQEEEKAFHDWFKRELSTISSDDTRADTEDAGGNEKGIKGEGKSKNTRHKGKPKSGDSQIDGNAEST